MRFADKRYYVEQYVKCANCGVLIYDEGIRPSGAEPEAPPYCSEWCIEWSAKRAAGDKARAIPLPRA